MSEKKPTPILPERSREVCPVCGTKSYSKGGIHPQCAVLQADAPRKKTLHDEKRAKLTAEAVERGGTFNRHR